VDSWVSLLRFWPEKSPQPLLSLGPASISINLRMASYLRDA
jgi:hypothetical protein